MTKFQWFRPICVHLSLFFTLVLAGCPRPSPEGPQAQFEADVTSGALPLTVQFTDLSTPGDSSIVSWLWLFGDGQSSAQPNPSHVYSNTGAYNVSLTITTDQESDTELKLNYISVEEPAQGEIATVTIMLPNNVPLEMVWVPSGTFMMGRYAQEPGSEMAEDPQHEVSVPGFWLAQYELTKRQWFAVMNATPWATMSNVLNDLDSPACYMTWDEAKLFLAEINAATALSFRLPSEAEWEYACRANTTTRFYWGDDLTNTDIANYAWYVDNAHAVNESYAHVVGQKLPNPFGLHDMSGNVSEWCEDDWHDSYAGAPTDGSPWVDEPRSAYHVWRGGDWYGSATGARSAFRYTGFPSVISSGLGLRLAR